MATKAASEDVKGDRQEAKARLKEARRLLAAGQYTQAETMATEVGTWGYSYGMFEDSPSKIVSASRAVRQRDAVRNLGAKGQPSLEIYALKVREARQYLAVGDLAKAEEAAQTARQLNVFPPVNADRADAVLHDIAMIKARGAAPAPAQVTAGAVGADPSVQRAGRSAPVVAPAPVDPAAADPLPIPAPSPFPGAVVDPTPNPVAAPPAADVLPTEPAQAPVPDASAPTAGPATPTNPGVQLLEQARALAVAGNFAAAKQAAVQARNGGFGVEAQADEALAQIGLVEQAGSLKFYESALDSMRKGDYDHARDLLTEMQSRELDEGTRQKVEDLLARLPQGKAGKATVGGQESAETVNAQRVQVEVGTKMAEARRLMEIDPDKAVELLGETLESIRAAGLPESVAKVQVRRVEVAIELAKKDKVSFDAKMKDKEYRAEIERKRLRHPRGRQGQEGPDQGQLMDQGPGVLRQRQARGGRGPGQAGRRDRPQQPRAGRPGHRRPLQAAVRGRRPDPLAQGRERGRDVQERRPHEHRLQQADRTAGSTTAQGLRDADRTRRATTTTAKLDRVQDGQGGGDPGFELNEEIDGQLRQGAAVGGGRLPRQVHRP